MIFRSWLTVDDLNYTEFLQGNFQKYETQIQQYKSDKPLIYHLLSLDFYTQTADFEQAKNHLFHAENYVKTPAEQAEYLLGEIFYQNRIGQIHQAGNRIEKNKPVFQSHTNSTFQVYYQLLSSNVYFRKGKVEKAFKIVQKIATQKPENTVLNVLIHLALSEYSVYLGELLKAEDFFEQAKHFLASKKAEYYIFLPVFHRHQAFLARSRFDLDKSQEHLENALRLNLNLYGKQHGDIASAYSEKAVIALQRGNYEKMNQLNGFSEKIRNYLYPENKAELSQNVALNAVYVGTQGDASQAVTLYEQAYQMLKKSTWIKNANLLGLKFSTAVFRAEEGNPEESLKKMQNILKETRKVRGRNFTELAPAHVFMAEAYLAMQNYTASRKYLMEAFRICNETIGEENIVYADCLKTFAKLYISDKQYSKAERTFIDALHLLASINQRNTLRFSTLLQELSELYQNVGETKKSVDYLQKCIQITEKLDAPSPLQILGLYLQICDYYAELKSPKAELYFEKLAQIGKNLPHDHPAHISILKTASNVKMQRKKYQEALNYSETIAQLLTIKKDFENPIYEDIELQIADLLLKTKQFERCIKRIKSLLAQRESKHFEYEMTLKLLTALRETGNFTEAENTCRVYMNRNAQLRDMSDYYVALALIYSESGKYGLSKKYFEKAVSNLNRVSGINSYRHLKVWESYKKLSKTMKNKQLEIFINEKLIEIRSIHLN